MTASEERRQKTNTPHHMIRRNMIRRLDKVAVIGLAMALSATPSFAATTGLPWEGPLTTLQNSLTGPVALAISLIAILVCGGLLIFGGELGDFAKRMVMLVLVIAVVVGGGNILATLFGFTALTF